MSQQRMLLCILFSVNLGVTNAAKFNLDYISEVQAQRSGDPTKGAYAVGFKKDTSAVAAGGATPAQASGSKPATPHLRALVAQAKEPSPSPSSALAQAGGSTDEATVIDATLGTIVGTAFQAIGTRQFLGIPFALPPVGRYRFAKSVLWDEPLSSSGAFMAKKFGSICPQPKVMFPWLRMDEDCLTLNIYAPLPSRIRDYEFGMRAPVMVFFHGGGFQYGASHYRGGDFQNYNASRLAQKGVIVVTVNYRLGLLGWSALPEQAQRGESTGNWGLWDKVTALTWVRHHIAKFGGNPNLVHIWGQSAGAISVCALLVMKESRGLFQSATMESAHCDALPLTSALTSTRKNTAHAVGCGSASDAELTKCLRSKPWKAYFEAQNASAGGTLSSHFLMYPVQDGVILSDHPFRLAARTSSHQSQLQPNVPIMLRQNYNAGSWFSKGFNGAPWVDEPNLTIDGVAMVQSTKPSFLNRSMYETLVNGYLSSILPYYPCVGKLDVVKEVLSMYPGDNTSDNTNRYSQFFADARYICPSHLFARKAAETASAYVYSWRHRCYPGVKPQAWGAYHGSELHYVFDQPSPNCPDTPAEKTMREFMSDTWVNFASTHEVPPHWPKYNNHLRIREVLAIGDAGNEADSGISLTNQYGTSLTNHYTNQYRKDECHLWRRVYQCE